jgi:esterase/lipase superfamily enzyme
MPRIPSAPAAAARGLSPLPFGLALAALAALASGCPKRGGSATGVPGAGESPPPPEYELEFSAEAPPVDAPPVAPAPFDGPHAATGRVPCPGGPPNPAALKDSDGCPLVDEASGCQRVRVFYVTDRARTDGAWLGARERELLPDSALERLHFGLVDVSIPPGHELGDIERPLSLPGVSFDEDPAQHLVVLNAVELDESTFLAWIRSRAARSHRSEALLFVHGYRTEFPEAAHRMAQMAWDLRFDGIPLLFSWPSDGALARYEADAADAAWAVPHLARALRMLVEQSGAENVHLVAHSMGNRVLTEALRQLPMDPAIHFNQVVLTAPDVDADVFRRDVAPRIRQMAQRVTVYASSRDKALWFSSLLSAVRRVGEAVGLRGFDGIDTVDVSSVDDSMLGHSYYGSNRAVLDDLQALLREWLPPEHRNLRALEGATRYFLLKD